MSRFKTYKLVAGVYAIYGTRLVVSRDDEPRYGRLQNWSISPADDLQRPLLTGTSMQDALARFEELLAGLESDPA